jgi:ribosomal protein S18 acetylase RimI-like enzyme
MAKKASQRGNSIRPIRPHDDIAAILDLIELGFKDELDPKGWAMLSEMRQLVHQQGFFRVLSGGTLETQGFVWVEDGTIVGNLSIRRAAPYHTHGRLIGNVVVHPDYRGRGIGRALMERAIATAKSRSIRWIGLEVRASNAIACGLYRRLGFQTVGQTQHLLRPAHTPWPATERTETSWRHSRPRDCRAWLALAQLTHGPLQRRVLEIRESRYRFGGLQRHLELWLNRQRERAWICGPTDMPRMAVRIKANRRNRYHVWDALMDPREGQIGAESIVSQASAHMPNQRDWPVVAIIPNQPPLRDAMIADGFEVHRTLQQMVMTL